MFLSRYINAIIYNFQDLMADREKVSTEPFLILRMAGFYGFLSYKIHIVPSLKPPPPPPPPEYIERPYGFSLVRRMRKQRAPLPPRLLLPFLVG